MMRLLLTFALAFASLCPQMALAQVYMTPEEVIYQSPPPRGRRAAEENAAQQNEARLQRLYSSSSSEAPVDPVTTAPAVHPAAEAAPDVNDYTIIQGTPPDILEAIAQDSALHESACCRDLTSTGTGTIALFATVFLVGVGTLWNASKKKGITR